MDEIIDISLKKGFGRKNIKKIKKYLISTLKKSYDTHMLIH